MKNLGLFIGLLFLYFIPASSQIKIYNFKVDSSCFKISGLIPENSLNSFKEYDYRKLLNGFEGKRLLFPNQNIENFYLTGKFKINEAVGDKMPTLVPNGNFPMNNFKPDSTVRYSLLIKKF